MVIAQQAFRAIVFRAVIAILQIGCCHSWACAQSEAEDITIQAMCDTGLTASAIRYATQRRALVSDDPELTAKWTMRLMECHAFAALHSSSQADTHWSMCQATRDEYLKREPASPRAPWLAWQLVRCDLLHAQAALASYLAAPARTQARELSLEIVRKIIDDLAKLQRDIEQRQPLAARAGIAGGKQAPAEQLSKLFVDVGLMRCEALLIRMRLYPSGSADCIASATDVDQQASKILQRTEPAWLSRSQLLVAQATAQLELGNNVAALERLEKLASQANNRQARIRAASVAIEFLAAHTNGTDSAARSQSLIRLLKEDEAGPELLLAEIELAIPALTALTGEAKDSALEQLIRKAKLLGQRYGDYWRSRAEARLVSSAHSASATSSSSVASDLMIAEVRQLLAAGDRRKAVERLLKFRDDEVAAERGEAALRVSMQAAALLQGEKAWQDAAECLLPVSLKFSSLPMAAEAHQQAIVCISQALREDIKNRDRMQQYEQLLQEQISLWPDAAATDQSAEWLVQWLAARGRHAELSDMFLSRAMSANEADIAQRALLDWLGEVLQLEPGEAVRAQLAAITKASEASAQADRRRLATLVKVAAWTATDWPTPSEQREQQRVVSDLMPSLPTPETTQIAVAVQLLDAIRGGAEWKDISGSLSQWQPSELSTSLREGFTRAFIEAIDETALAAHAAWAKRLKLDGDWQQQLLQSSRPLSRAYGLRITAWIGDETQAIQKLRSLAAQAQRTGGQLQLELANALADAGAVHLDESSQVAKVLVANSAAGSELQYAARWRLCKNQNQAGRVEEARQAAKLLLASQPMEPGVWKTRFESLLSP